MPISGAGPSSAPECFRQLGMASSTETRSNRSVDSREEPELDGPEMLNKSLPRSLSRCSEVSTSQEAASEDERSI